MYHFSATVRVHSGTALVRGSSCPRALTRPFITENVFAPITRVFTSCVSPPCRNNDWMAMNFVFKAICARVVSLIIIIILAPAVVYLHWHECVLPLRVIMTNDIVRLQSPRALYNADKWFSDNLLNPKQKFLKYSKLLSRTVITSLFRKTKTVKRVLLILSCAFKKKKQNAYATTRPPHSIVRNVCVF